MRIKWLLKFLLPGIYFLFEVTSAFSIEIFPKNTHLDFYLDKEARGEKITLPGMIFCMYTSNQDKQNLGLSMNAEAFCKYLPWSIKAGNLTPVALYSKLKSPLLSSTVSPFGSVAGEAACVNANLPSHVSFNRPSSYFLQCGYTNKKTVLRNVLFNYWNSGEETIDVVSGKIKFVPFKNFSVAASVCFGYFDYSDNSSTSWFMEEPYYHEGTHFCTAGQFSLGSTHQKTLFTMCLFENPYGSYERVFRGETKINSNHFIFNFAGAFVPEKCITSDDSTLAPQIQLKGGVQYHFVAGEKVPVFVKTGFGFYSKINLEPENAGGSLTEENESVQKHPLKLCAGIQVSSAITAVNFVTTVNGAAKVTDAGTTQLHFDNGGFTLKNTWYLQNFCPTLSAGITFNPSDDYTSLTTVQNYEFNYAFTGNPNISDKYKISITRKNGLVEKKSFTSSVNLKTKIRRVSCTCKFGMSLDF